ncbi:polysaccharide biosynthesis tyrosine autokinase [Paraburkholderia sp. GAS348]|uniref:polysaccharide biosynthesis tyrosine autokinase n=1 Tax=Paraburkholderia sp. GAS348 TaxID=3035132 RepID=UPI003D22DE72
MASIPENQYIDPSAGDEIHLSDYLAVVVERWRMIIAIAAVVLVLGTLYAVTAPSVYQADAVVQVEESSSSAKGALGDLASIFDTKATAAAEIELIRSRLVVGETVRQLHLDISASPRYFPAIGAPLARRAGGDGLARPLFGLSSFAWGGERIAISQFDVPKGWVGTPFVLTSGPDGAYELSGPGGAVVLRGRVGEQSTGVLPGGQIALKVDTLTARPRTQFVLARHSTLAAITNLQKALVIAEKTKQSGVVGVALDGADSQGTAAIVNTIAQQYVKQNIDRKSAEAEHTLTFLDQQLPQLRKELDQAEERYNTFRNKQGTVDLSAESQLLLQQIVDGKTQILALQQQRDVLKQTFADAHPSVAALNSQLALLQRVQDDLTHRVSTLPDTEQTALRLLRDVRVDTELYTNLLNSAQQLRIVKAGQVGNVRVVDYAVVAESPIRPNKLMMISLSAILGLLLGVVAAFARKLLFGGVEHSEVIEQAFGVPVYAVVPHSVQQVSLQQAVTRGHQAQNVLAVHATEDVAIEGMRSLRTALQFSALDISNNVVMVTGPRPEVGKSFVSINLAAVVAAGGKRVLLIDGDMRRGDVHSKFGVRRHPGLSDAIAGADIESSVLRDVLPGLDILPKGTLPPNPAELLMTERFKTMLESLSSRYDIVIVDTPPVLAVTDSTLIGKYAATTLLVVRHGQHSIAEIGETMKRLRNNGIALKGVVFTDVPQRRFGYGAYYSGYYSYASSLK